MKRTWLNLAGVLGLMILALWLSVQISAPLRFTAKTGIVVIIEKGQGTKDIAKYLERQKFIRSSFFFQAYSFLTGASHKLQAGEYLLSPSLSLSQIVRKLATGDVHKEAVTFVEGWSVKDYPILLEFLNFEGYLFPDTYFVRTDETPESIVRRMLQNFDKHFTPQLRTETQRQKKTIFQVVTMASLLEKEVPGLQDRKIVAGVLWKRLKAGVALQVDATVLYVKGEHTVKISKEDTQIDSPYNTYKYPGLPVGPIGNPGMESILAALYPTESPYWYYLSTLTGETIFSKTLEDHNLAKAKYLKGY
ncbi:MAG: hypothetical protein Greene071421_124 [Parcubacteria group bacterium Greene0714_21]|nr:MAG: hypothetical protein Greene041639_227 [Parcubacteria group bacterium Greene0416_39]TSC98527.1 MAG: hypothetical protein Greene101447_29 [Parcubacteria group bacterium Greene1014_47]TSD04288.1 MAG: hypothetical protein Greene071421_124 [Parcubacteria group bacterium Greene0714_21]